MAKPQGLSQAKACSYLYVWVKAMLKKGDKLVRYDGSPVGW